MSMAPTFQFDSEEILSKGTVCETVLKSLRQWAQKSQKYSLLSDEQLILFAISCNNNPIATQRTIEAYFRCKIEGPEFFRNRNFRTQDMVQITKCIEAAVLPTRTKDNKVIVFGRLKDTRYYNFNLTSMVKLSCMLLELPLVEEVPPSGLIVVLDFKGVGLMHLTTLRPSALKKFFDYLQEGLPCQLERIHILNVVWFIDKVLAIIKPVMKRELLELFSFHPSSLDMEEFFREHVSEDCFPGDYGGSLPTLENLCEDTYKRVRANDDYYRDDEEQIRAASKACV